MSARRFYVGQEIIGNSEALIYTITCPGWKGTVVENLDDGQIRVRGLNSSDSWRVEECRFDPLYPAEPARNAEGKAICAHCGKVIEDEATLVWVREGAICKDCGENEYSLCEECGELRPKAELKEVDGIKLCAKCVQNPNKIYHCECCGEIHMRYNASGITGYGGHLCSKCVDSDEYVRCAECGRYFRTDDVTRSRTDNRYRCADCERLFKARAIKEYGYKPDPIYKVHDHPDFFADLKIKDLLFGVELEVDRGVDREGCAAELLEASADIYCKRDGSLSNGIEIVTHPCTLEYHMKDLEWEKLAKIALSHEFRSQEAGTCGLHVHVGRRQMGKNVEERSRTAAKIVLLADRHWASLVKFSRRKISQLEHWASRPEVDYTAVEYGEKSLKDVALETKRAGRYQAINLENRNTVEFRLFNGTLKVSTILATLQLVSRMVTYAKEKTEEECMMSTWRDIVSGNIIDSAEYKELAEYLEARGLVDGEAPTEYIWKPAERKFKVGEKVVITNADGNGVGALNVLIGEVATIARVLKGPATHSGGRFNYIVDFGRTAPGLYDPKGILGRETGYMVYEKNLRKYEEE